MKNTEEEYIAYLYRLINELSPLTQEAWKELKPLFSLQVVKKGEFFIKAKMKQHKLGFVAEGIIRGYYVGPNGVEYNQAFFLKGDFIKESSFDKENYIYGQALEDAVILVADNKEIEELFSQFHCIEKFGRRMVEVKLERKENRELRFLTLEGKERYDFFLKEHPGLANRIPQYHIASYLGVSATQLCRIRAKVKVGKTIEKLEI